MRFQKDANIFIFFNFINWVRHAKYRGQKDLKGVFTDGMSLAQDTVDFMVSRIGPIVTLRTVADGKFWTDP